MVGDRTPGDLQEAYVRGGAALIDYLESDDHFEFTVLPWPDYFGKADEPAWTVCGTSSPLPCPATYSAAMPPTSGARWTTNASARPPRIC